jgi:hypothetical protein
MSGICSKHRGHDPNCELCTAMTQPSTETHPTMPRTKALTLTELAKINHVSARRAQSLSDYFAKVAIVASDAHAEKRLAARLCLYCFYLERSLAGQAFTKWSCVLCGEPQPMHHNTNVPRVCQSCADAFDLCVQCSGTRDCRQRSRFDRRARRRKKGQCP